MSNEQRKREKSTWKRRSSIEKWLRGQVPEPDCFDFHL